MTNLEINYKIMIGVSWEITLISQKREESQISYKDIIKKVIYHREKTIRREVITGNVIQKKKVGISVPTKKKGPNNL